MNDFSYDILDLLKKYDGDTQAALLGENSPQCLYAFSPLRENLFEWVDFKKDDRILQIGSDYGSYTGCLARRAGEVVVLDPRDENLEVNRLRHKDLRNVSYIRGAVADESGHFTFPDKTSGQRAQTTGSHAQAAGMQSVGAAESPLWHAYKPPAEDIMAAAERMSRPFDCVVMAGFLEQYDKEEAKSILAFAAGFLKPGGALLAAVENEMGVRYLMGAKPYQTAFLEREIRSLMGGLTDRAGGHVTLYYPVPDYRYPAVIFSDTYLPQAGEVTNVSARLEEPGFWYGNEEEAMAKACQNGVFAQFTNSFLAVWEKGKQ